MTKVSYNVVDKRNNVIESDITSYPQAAIKAANSRGQVVTIYTSAEIKDKYQMPKHRLVAHL